MTDRQTAPGEEEHPVIDTAWVDSDEILRLQQRRRAEAEEIAAKDHATADWFDRIDNANHFRQRWATITGRSR